MIKTLLTHKSIRKYLSDAINTDIINNILTAGIRASNTGNMQVYSIIVSSRNETKQKLWEVHFKQDMILQAPLLITFCADFNRFVKWCKIRNADPGYDNFLSFITAAADALIVAQNVAIAAENYGLGICYLGTTVYNAGKIIDILNIPKGVVPVTSLIMGYPDETPELTDRLPLEAVIHSETYHDYSTDDIDNYYHDKENLPLTKDLLIINKKETLAQIFTDNRYTRKDNVLFSKSFLDVIKKQGFMNND
jgi:nitroreductase